jgi:hypothetical protein
LNFRGYSAVLKFSRDACSAIWATSPKQQAIGFQLFTYYIYLLFCSCFIVDKKKNYDKERNQAHSTKGFQGLYISRGSKILRIDPFPRAHDPSRPRRAMTIRFWLLSGVWPALYFSWFEYIYLLHWVESSLWSPVVNFNFWKEQQCSQKAE